MPRVPATKPTARPCVFVSWAGRFGLSPPASALRGPPARDGGRTAQPGGRQLTRLSKARAGAQSTDNAQLTTLNRQRSTDNAQPTTLPLN
jgi:hypothetical protein